jgi:hypothetical protein
MAGSRQARVDFTGNREQESWQDEDEQEKKKRNMKGKVKQALD